ncbi:MAG: hypothetical protein KA467_00950 [Bacteroidales bacterium]|nr:hypothetical protein [Bacteroidales bacterium]
MASNVFYQFDVGKQNIMSNYDFSRHDQRQNGVGTGAALSSLHNKLFYQVSTITSALAEVMKNNGYDMGSSIESSWSATVTQLSNIVTKAFLTANHYTKAETQSYVTGLLSLYPTIQEMNAAITAALTTGGSTTGATLANIKTAITAAFSLDSQTITTDSGTITFSAYQATATDVDNGTNSTKYVNPASIKDSIKVPHGQPTEGNIFLGNGSKWESKPKSSLGFLSDADLSTYALKSEIYTRDVLNGGQLDSRYFTERELNPYASPGANVLDARYYTQTAADNKFLTPSSISSTKQTSGCVKIPSGTTGGILICWGILTISKSQSGDTYQKAPLQTAPNFAASFNGAPFTVIIGNAILEHADNDGYIGIHVVGQYSSYFTYKVCARGTKTEMPNQTVQYVAFGQY